jgi:hypothetical protein
VASTKYEVQLFDDDDSNDGHQDVVQRKRGAARKFASYKFIFRYFYCHPRVLRRGKNILFEF